MDKFWTVAEVAAPIFAAFVLGMIAQRRQWLKEEGVQGFQQFVMQLGLPCLVFGSCLRADLGMEVLSSMAMVLPPMIALTLWAFHARKKQLPYHNLPMLFSAQETGMLGIPLFMILFGAGEAYRMGMLDLAQAATAYPVIAILSTGDEERTNPGEVVKKVFRSPLLIMSLTGLTLNLTGIGGWLDAVGAGAALTACTDFLGQPISALMLFSVGYHFSLTADSRKAVVKVSLLHFALLALVGLGVQLVLGLMGAEPLTRWALLLYFLLPASYLAPGLGKNQQDQTMASGVCSVLTVVTLVIFSIMAAVVA